MADAPDVLDRLVAGLGACAADGVVVREDDESGPQVRRLLEEAIAAVADALCHPECAEAIQSAWRSVESAQATVRAARAARNSAFRQREEASRMREQAASQSRRAARQAEAMSQRWSRNAGGTGPRTGS